MVLGVPRCYCVVIVIAIILLLIGTVGCGGGAAASTTNPGGGSNAPQSAELAINPTSVDFAQQSLNTASTAQSVALRNPGTTSLGISSITLDGDFTQNNNCGTSIAPSATCTVAIVFDPAATGARAGTLQIAEASGKIHRIPVKGTGTAGQLAATPASLDFGNVGIGQNSAQSLKLTNVGGANLTISSVSTVSAGFSVAGPTLPLVLAKGTSTTFTVTFNPSSAGTTSASIAVVNSATIDPVTVAAVGTGVTPGQLVASAANLAFGSVAMGQSSLQTVKITNTGGADVTVSSVTANGTGFSVSGIVVPFTIASGASRDVNVVFAPTASGDAVGSLYIRNSTSTAPLTLNLSGTGTAAGQLIANPATLDFGSINTGQSSSKVVTLSNTGTASLTISTVTASGTGFSINGVSTPMTLAPGASTTVNVTFNPSASGSAAGSVSVTNSASSQPLTIALSGVGNTGAQLTANPTNLYFGSVTTGQNSVKTITISNTGAASLTVSSVQTAGTGFSASSTAVPFTMGPGTTSTISVTFAPTTSGTVGGSLYIRNSTTTAPLTLPLAATGVGAGQLTVSPTGLDFASVTVGQSSTKSVTLSNTGTASLTVSSVTTASAGFSVSGISVPLTLAAGATTSFSVTFAPSTTGSATGSASVLSSVAAQPVTVSLSGTGATPGQLTASPTSLDFGSVTVGQSKNQTVTLSNTGGTSVSITSVTTAGTGFSATAGTLPLTIAAGASKTVTVTFSPSASGSVTGSLYVRNSTSTTPLTLALNGVAVAVTQQLSANPTNVSFGTVYVGQSSTKSIALNNTGTTSLTITGISTDGPGFSASLSVPLTLAAGASTSVNVMFGPTNSGTASGNVYISDSIRAQDVIVPLSGTAASAAIHSVSLSWIGSASASTLAGYNVYRGTQRGGPYTRINTTTQNLTSYDDSAVQNGSTYYYVVTAVDQSSAESAYSNEATAQVPTT